MELWFVLSFIPTVQIVNGTSGHLSGNIPPQEPTHAKENLRL